MLGLDGSDDLPFIFLQRFFVLRCLGGYLWRPYSAMYFSCLLLLGWHAGSYYHQFSWMPVWSIRLFGPPFSYAHLLFRKISIANWVCVFYPSLSTNILFFFFLVGYRAWVAVVSLHWRPAYWPSAMVSTTERPWTTKESGRNLWRLGRAPGASRICGR